MSASLVGSEMCIRDSRVAILVSGPPDEGRSVGPPIQIRVACAAVGCHRTLRVRHCADGVARAGARAGGWTPATS
eukprot:12676239-Alexandrium_andersonii.AAC.1